MLDNNGQIVINDRNWDLVPFWQDEFLNFSQLSNKWAFHYGGRNRNEEFFNISGDNFTDNILSADLNYPLVNQYPDCINGIPYGINELTNNNFSGQETRVVSNSTVTLFRKSESTNINSFDQPDNNPFCNTFGTTWVKYPRSYQYSEGKLFSRQNFKYGFFEARFKINQASSNCEGIGHCFWMFPKDPISNGINYCEIDIAENDPRRNLMTSNVHFSGGTTNPTWACRSVSHNNTSYSDIEVQQQQFHTYSLEWTPSEINTYYDNVLVLHTELTPFHNGPYSNDGPLYPSMLDNMNIFLDIEGAINLNGVNPRFGYLIDPAISLPFEFTIDYVKVYKLNNSTCSTVINFPNYNFSTYSYGIKKSITLGQLNCITCKVLISNGENVSLRASDFIELNDGFEVDDNNNTKFFCTVNGNCDK